MEQGKSNVGTIVLAIIITAIVVGGGVYLWQKNQIVQPNEKSVTPVATTPTKVPPKEEPLSYSTDGVSVSVSKKIAPSGYTSGQLKAMAQGCDSKQSDGYFDQLASKFNTTNKIIYNFKYTGTSQFPETDTYVVTLLPNKAGYVSLDQFKKDFSVCEAGGGDGYPKMLNSNWLLFASTCGNGLDDGSGQWAACNMIRDAVESTFKLN